MAGKGGVRPHASQRGELGLVLAGSEMVLRPTYEAITAFESITGKGLIDLTRDALAAKLTVAELSQIACECIRAWGREVGDDDASGANAKKIAALIIDSDGGVKEAMATIAGMLAMASTGGYTSKGEVKPTTKK